MIIQMYGELAALAFLSEQKCYWRLFQKDIANWKMR